LLRSLTCLRLGNRLRRDDARLDPAPTRHDDPAKIAVDESERAIAVAPPGAGEGLFGGKAATWFGRDPTLLEAPAPGAAALELERVVRDQAGAEISVAGLDIEQAVATVAAADPHRWALAAPAGILRRDLDLESWRG
jgi:hypothetical protein